MGIVEIIRWCVTIVVLIIMLRIYQLITLGAPEKPGLDNLPSRKISSTIWGFISVNLGHLFMGIIMAITMIWIFWHFLKWISPFILGFGDLIVAVVPPFPELEDAGIFRLWDDFIPSLLTLNFRGMFRALARFFKKGGKYVARTVMGTVRSKTHVASNKKGDKPQKSSSPKVVSGNAETDTAGDAEGEGRGTDGEDAPEYRDASQESKYSAQEHKAIETKMSMCIAEKANPVDPTASFIDKMKTRMENAKASVGCQAQSIGQYNQMKKYK